MKTKRIMEIILAVVMFSALLLTGAAASEEITAEEIIANLEEAMAEVTNFNAGMEMYMTMDMADEYTEMNMTADIAMFTEPLKMFMDASIDMTVPGMENTSVAEGEAMVIPMQMYLVDDALYTNTFGMWMKQEIGAEMARQYNIKETYKDFTTGFETMTLLGIEPVNDRDVYVLEGTITGDSLKAAFNNLGIISSMAGLVDYDAMLENMGEINATFYVYTDTFLFAGYEMDLGDIMKNLMGSVASEDASSGFGDLLLSFFYTGYNEAEDFELPAEALEAADATEMLGDTVELAG